MTLSVIMAKKRIGVWLSTEQITAMDMIAAMTQQSRSRVINTLLGESIDGINEQMRQGSDEWKRKQWD